jgi:signal transduction histidine kinase
MLPIPISQLRTVIALNELPDEHLQWILDRSTYREFEMGEVIAKYGDVADTMWILLEGKVSFYLNKNGKHVYYFTFENTEQIGGVGGILPYSRMKTIPGWSYAECKVKMLGLHKKYFEELEELNPAFIQRLISFMTERAKYFATKELQQEKVNALGNLAAGIAHELNNPAAAINRIACELGNRMNQNFELTEKLVEKKINAEILNQLHHLADEKINKPSPSIKPSTLERMDLEDRLNEWFTSFQYENRVVAETFSEHDFNIEELSDLKNKLGTDAFMTMLPWLENNISTQKIIKDLGLASQHISTLVTAIKTHVHMDRSTDLQPTDIHQDIENVLTLIGHKLKHKKIIVHKHFDPSLPKVPAYVGELNQVWSNIIDNAIYALPTQGELTIETSHSDDSLHVSITDNGSGIPKEIIHRILILSLQQKKWVKAPE